MSNHYNIAIVGGGITGTALLFVLSKYHPEFYSPVKLHNDSYFVILALLEYLVKTIYPDKSIKNDFDRLLLKYPGVPINKMGFPTNWQDCAVFEK